MAQDLAPWWHPVASSEALDKLHWVMCSALYHRILMVIKIANNLLRVPIVDVGCCFTHHFLRQASALSKTQVAIELN
jgi:hypothetical protein